MILTTLSRYRIILPHAMILHCFRRSCTAMSGINTSMNAETMDSNWCTFCQTKWPMLCIVLPTMSASPMRGIMLTPRFGSLSVAGRCLVKDQPTQQDRSILAECRLVHLVGINHGVATRSSPTQSSADLYTVLQAEAETTRILQATPTSLRVLTRPRTPETPPTARMTAVGVTSYSKHDSSWGDTAEW